MMSWESEAMVTATRLRSHDRTRQQRCWQGRCTLSAVCCLAVTIIWAATGRPVLAHVGVDWPRPADRARRWRWRRASAQPRGPRRRLADPGLRSPWSSAAICVIVWAMAGFGYFWPVFPAVGLAMAFALHARVLLTPARPTSARASTS